MVDLHNKNGEIIRINLNEVYELKRHGNRTVLKARLQSGTVEFEVLESYDQVAELHGTLRQ
jgi:hypothetical protein